MEREFSHDLVRSEAFFTDEGITLETVSLWLSLRNCTSLTLHVYAKEFKEKFLHSSEK